MYQRSVEDPSGFWADIASQFYWKEKWDHQVCHDNLDIRKGKIHIEVPASLYLFPIQSRTKQIKIKKRTFLLTISFALTSGSKVGSPIFVTTAWIETLNLEMVTKLQFIGKEMSLELREL